jgi:hypothetical protein
MDNPKLGWVNEVEGRVKRAKSAWEDATARRERAEAHLNSLHEILKNAQEEAKDATLKEKEALEELENAEAIQQAVEAKHGVVTLEDDEEEEGKRSDGAVKRRAVTPTEQLENAPGKTPRLEIDISRFTSIESIVVSECGVDTANGTYKKWGGFNRSCPYFLHSGMWKGEDATFQISYLPSTGWTLTLHCECVRRRSGCHIKDNPFDQEWSVDYRGVNRIDVYPPPKFEVKLFRK